MNGFDDLFKEPVITANYNGEASLWFETVPDRRTRKVVSVTMRRNDLKSHNSEFGKVVVGIVIKTAQTLNVLDFRKTTLYTLKNAKQSAGKAKGGKISVNS